MKDFRIIPGFWHLVGVTVTVKHVLSGHSKIDKKKDLKTNVSLMKVESIAECILHSAIHCNFDLY